MKELYIIQNYIKRPTSNLTVNMNSNSVVEFNGETKSGTSLSFNNIPAGDYLIEINRNNIDELQKEMIHSASAYPRLQARVKRTIAYTPTDDGAAGFPTVCDSFN